jgi:hypothetical protein
LSVLIRSSPAEISFVHRAAFSGVAHSALAGTAGNPGGDRLYILMM